ncbi:hypothetical protein [Ancylobacter sp.]|uniref:hypothetical protein n=1 Tax=Ancylobacter sp. TaxID=1872567 RepID=UPI003BA902DD
MPQQKLLLKPGINTQATQTLAEGTWSTSNLIRWRDGYLEKLGGWQKYDPVPCVGVVRGLHSWMDLSAVVYLATGSDQRLQLYTQGAVFDITPIRATDSVTSALSTTSGSSTVAVNAVAHQVNVGDWVRIFNAVSVGGIVLLGYYRATTIIDADNFEFDAGVLATATVAAGGNTPFFTTTNGSATVSVLFEDHGYSPGETFEVQVSTSVGGLTIIGAYLVETVPDVDNFTITAVSGASSADTAYENGNAVDLQFLLQSGPSTNIPLIGWGSGAWGSGTWGFSSSASSAVLPLRNWFLDNFGEYLIAQYTNGPFYVWQPPIGANNPATLIATAPTINTASFVAMPQAQVVALGAEVLGSQDPLLVRWSDAGNYTNWTASATNQAGSFRLSRGSRIIGGLQAPQTSIIWTDTDCWTMQYIGTPFIYSFDTIGTGCGLIAPKAAACLGRNTYWMSSRGFFMFGDSGVSPITCDVWDQVFARIDFDNANKSIAAANSLFHEIAFYFPSLDGTGEIDSYVKLNTITGEWDYGSLTRTAWLDQSIIGAPVGVDLEHYIQQHEVSDNADGAAMTGVYVETGYIDIAEGLDYPFVDMIIPDFKWRGENAQVSLTLFFTDFPGSEPTVQGPMLVTPATTFISLRARARQIALRIEDESLGWWRLGAVRVRTAPSGRQ